MMERYISGEMHYGFGIKVKRWGGIITRRRWTGWANIKEGKKHARKWIWKRWKEKEPRSHNNGRWWRRRQWWCSNPV